MMPGGEETAGAPTNAESYGSYIPYTKYGKYPSYGAEVEAAAAKMAKRQSHNWYGKYK